MRASLALFLPIISFLPGCSSSDQASSSALAWDSAGIRIVENSLATLASAPEWELARTPTIKVGVLEGEEPFQFHQIRGAVLLGNLIWVLDRGSSELRAFQMDGSHALTAGGSGEGPGEFVLPVHLGVLPPDTLLVWDQEAQRISYFDLTGHLLRSIPIRAGLLSPSFLSAAEDGSFLFSSFQVGFPSTGSVETTPIALTRFDSGGALEDTLAVFPHLRMKRVERPLDFTWVAFSPLTVMAAGRRTVWTGTGEDLEIQERTPSGALVQMVRWQAPDRTVLPEHVEAYYSGQLEGAETEERRRQIQQTWDQTPVAEEFPALADLAVDRKDRVWLLEWARPTEEGPYRWIIFDQDGAILARMRIPRDFTVHEFGEDYILGVAKGDYDEEYVVLYEIQEVGPDG